MCSLTQSSAGPFSAVSPISSKRQAPTSSLFTPSPPILTSHNTDTVHGHSHPVPPPSIHHPFFKINDASNVFSLQAQSYVSQAIQNSWAESTVRRYSGAIKQYILFCNIKQVPGHLHFPADEFILCAFTASSLSKHASSTTWSRLSALKAWHFTHNLEWKGSTWLHYVLNSIHNLAPSISKCPPLPPISSNMLVQLVNSLDLKLLLDVAIATWAVMAFWGQCHLGKLLPLSLATAFCTPLPTRADFKRSLQNSESCLLHLSQTKTHHHGQDVVLVDQQHPVNPIYLLKKHLQTNNVPSNTHIFSYTTVNGPLSLTKSLFLQKCNAIWQQLGYPQTTSHCFHIGGTTELLVAETPPNIVKATGQWSSESFLWYWRSLDDIAPQHVHNLHRHKCRHRNH